MDLCNEFLAGTHVPNKIDKHVLPEHIWYNFAAEGNYLQVAGLHADCPDDVVCMAAVCFGIPCNKGARQLFYSLSRQMHMVHDYDVMANKEELI